MYLTDQELIQLQATGTCLARVPAGTELGTYFMRLICQVASSLGADLLIYPEPLANLYRLRVGT